MEKLENMMENPSKETIICPKKELEEHLLRMLAQLD